MAHFIDLTGQRFGRLTVLHKTETSHGYVHWLCKCDCGNTTSPSGMALRRKATQSCGCLRAETVSLNMLQDLTGKKFGHLTVVSQHGHQGKDVVWNCSCDCGNDYVVRSAGLRRGACQSCGKCKYEGHVLPSQIVGSRRALRRYKLMAAGRNIPWNLSEDDFFSLIKKNCYYCGDVPSNREKGSKRGEPFLYTGIDRQDNKLGYIVNNCVPCCKTCNRWKSDMSEEKFHEHIYRVASFKKTAAVAAGE